jgi:hypothetical protein
VGGDLVIPAAGGKATLNNIEVTLPFQDGAQAVGDHGYGSRVFYGDSQSVFVGDAYVLTSSGSWAQADASSASTSTGMIAISLGTNADEGLLLDGTVRVPVNGTSPTTGDIVYLDPANAGELTVDKPTTAGNVVRVVGYIMESGAGSPKVYFRPDNTWIEL